jgi:hypothetical protein
MNPTETQIVRAILNSQASIKINGKEVELPSPQTAGTEYQKYAYARQVAEKILEKGYYYEKGGVEC